MHLIRSATLPESLKKKKKKSVTPKFQCDLVFKKRKKKVRGKVDKTL